MPLVPKLKPLVILLFLLLSACSTPIPDVFVFEDLEPKNLIDPVTGHLMLVPHPDCMDIVKEVSCGHGVAIVSGKEIFVGEGLEHLFNEKPWSQLKAESIYMPAVESYAPLSVYVINSCKELKCDKRVEGFKVKLDELGALPTLVKGIKK